MSKSLAAAQKAAIEGENEEWDTQMCMEIQEEFLSSSPVQTSSIVASANLLRPKASPLLGQEPGIGFEENVDEYWKEQLSDGHELNDREVPAATNVPISNAQLPKDAPTITYKKNEAGKYRAYNILDEEILPLGFQENYRRLRQIFMDDMTMDNSQKSSVSLTQANSASVYERFNQSHGDYLSTATPGDQPANSDSLNLRYASARTESTAVTYQEDDMRHIKVDFEVEESQVSEHIEEDGELEESQDPNAALQAEMNGHYDPQTPAAPINPFTLQGSVMKGAELFGATQPSSIGRHFETPVSARPSSPNIYNSVSPPKRRRDMLMSSPSTRGGLTNDAFIEGEAETSPAKYSAWKSITHSVSMDSPFAPDLRSTSLERKYVNEPRSYHSMAASQKKRSMRDPTPESSDSDDGFDDDIPAGPRRKDTDVERILASVELRKKPTQTSSTPAAVEVPSTRRSLQEEYIAQYEGLDTRDTPQTEETQSQNDTTDEIIVDSQALPALPEMSSVHMVQSSEPLPPVHPQPAHVQFEVSSPSHQEDSSNTQEFGTPIRKPINDFTVPETSPSNEPTTPANTADPASPEDFLRPMGDVASFSHSVEDDMDFNKMVGFTQDVDFEEVRRMGDSSPMTFKVPPLHRHLPDSLVAPLLPFRATEIFPDDNNAGISRLGTNHIAAPILAVPAIPVAEEAQPVPTKPDSSDVSSISTTVSSSLSEMDIPPRPTNIFSPNLPQDATPSPVTESAASDHERVATHAPPSHGTEEHNIQMDNFVEDEQAPLFENGKANILHDNTTNNIEAGIDIEAALPKHKVNVQEPPLSKITNSRKKTAKSKAPITRSGKKPSAASLRRIANAGTSTNPASTPDPVNSTSGRRTSKRATATTPVQGSTVSTRHSTRKSTMRESSEDPLALGVSATSFMSGTALFAKMSFAISYVNPDNDRDAIVKLINNNGGTILQEGFDVLFEPSNGDTTELRLSTISKDIGFTALIADEHSRKVKFMHALALGLPCISGYWVSACVSKGRVVDWAPYLLCAGMSSILHATKSRMLSSYSAEAARLADVIMSRDQLLEGKSILFVAGKTKAEVETRQAYTFLTRVLGPARITRVGDLYEARKKLVDGDEKWDMLYVDVNKERAEKAVFGDASSAAVVTKGRGRKRKRAKDEDDEVDMGPPPAKRIPIIVDETMVQSLIMGQLLDG